MVRRKRFTPEQPPLDNPEIVEKRLRRKIIALARAAGGRIGLTRMVSKISEVEGEAGGNAAVSLAFILQEEGVAKLDIDAEEEIIMVELTDEEAPK